MREDVNINGLSGTLGDYVGISMAAKMLGRSPEQTGPVYNLIKDNGIKVHKIGGVALIEAAEFAKAAGISNYESEFPDGIASIPMSYLYSRMQVAKIMDVSWGTVNKLANEGKVRRLDLSPWHMHSLYIYTSGVKYSAPHVIRIKEYDISIEYTDMLHITIETERAYNLEAACWGPEPSKAWYLDGGDPAIEIEVQKIE